MSSQRTEPSFLPLTPPNESSIAIGSPQKRRLYCLTVCGYRKPTLSEEEYGEYMTKTHSQLLKGLMAKYGVIRWTQVGNIFSTLHSPSLMLPFLSIKHGSAWCTMDMPRLFKIRRTTLILTIATDSQHDRDAHPYGDVV